MHSFFAIMLGVGATLCQEIEGSQPSKKAEVLTVGFGLTQVYQQNARGGTSTASNLAVMLAAMRLSRR